MGDFFLSFLLGIVEGLTEFLPVSSTAHLRLAEQLMQISLADGFWKMYTIVIQLGAILCLPVYFWNRILGMLSTFPRGERGDRTWLTHPLSLVMLAFVCTAGPAFLMTKIIGKHLESLSIIGMSLFVGGIVMYLVDRYFSQPAPTQHMEEMSLFQAVWIGFCQVLSAVFPGTSRSMSTIAAGQLSGMTREAALEFSFFLSIPTMAAATLYDLYKSLKPGAEAGLATVVMDAHNWITLGIGFVVSFVVAYFAVKWFMGWVREHGLAPFAAYRIVLGLAVLAWVMTHPLPAVQ